MVHAPRSLAMALTAALHIVFCMSNDRLEHRVMVADLDRTCLRPCFDHCIAVADRWARTRLIAPPPSPYLRLLVTHSGRAELLHAGGSVVLGSRSIALLTGGWAYRERHNTAGWHMHGLLVSGPWVQALDTQVRALGGTRVIDDAPGAWRVDLTDAVEAVLASNDDWPWHVATLLARVIPALTSVNPDDDWARRLRRAVHAHPDRPWPVAALARIIGVSPSSFAHRAPQMLGSSPAHWLRRERIVLAQRWLADAPVQVVAARLGFATPFHFSRVFREETGVPPSNWRQRIKAIDP